MAVITIDGKKLEVPDNKMSWNAHLMQEYIFHTFATIKT